MRTDVVRESPFTIHCLTPLRCSFSLRSLVTAQDAGPLRELSEMGEGPRATEIVATRVELDVEEILPGSAAHRTAFELGEIDVAQREDAERFEQRAGRARQREHDRRLVGIGRLSSLLRLISRSANTLSALNSEPGVLGSANTIVVLLASFGGAPPMTKKRVMLYS